MNIIKMSYQEWLKANHELKEEDYPCPECGGDGEIECGCCGHTNDCHACMGRGTTLYWDYLKQAEKERLLLEKSTNGCKT